MIVHADRNVARLIHMILTNITDTKFPGSSEINGKGVYATSSDPRSQDINIIATPLFKKRILRLLQ